MTGSRLPRSKQGFTVLPEGGCRRKPPAWPLSKATSAETKLWNDLWMRPIAEWWWSTQVPPTVVARYVRLVLGQPEHSQAGLLEKELGLTPASMVRLKLEVGERDAQNGDRSPKRDPYKHLRSVK